MFQYPQAGRQIGKLFVLSSGLDLNSVFQYPQAGRQIGKLDLPLRHCLRGKSFSTLKRVDKLENADFIEDVRPLYGVSVPSSGSTNWKTFSFLCVTFVIH